MRETILLDLGDLGAPKGTQPWIKAVHEEAKAALNSASAAKEHVQAWVSALKERNHFQRLADANGRPFMLWEMFCTAAQPYGLGYSPAAIDGIIAERDSLAALDARDKALSDARPLGINQYSPAFNNVKSLDSQDVDPPMGNSRQQAIRKLRTARKDLHERVLAGELSPHAAMVEAGFRKQTITVPLDVHGIASTLRRRLTPQQVCELIEALQERGTR